MWYTHLNRNQHYLRAYRTHNLWLDYYHLKTRTARVAGLQATFVKRIAKTYSGVSEHFTALKFGLTHFLTLTLALYSRLASPGTFTASPFSRSSNS